MTSSLHPVPVPGELVYGIVAAHTHRFRLSTRHGARMLFGRQAPASLALPGRLENLARVLPVAICAAELTAEHTLLGLYTPFLNEQVRQECERRAREGAGLHLVVGRATSRVVRHRCMMACPACSIHDLAAFGRTTWHREHQADGVFFCPQHQCQLYSTGIRPYEVYASAQFIVPARANGHNQENIPPEWTAILQKVAVYMSHLLCKDTPQPGASKLRSYYVTALLQRKLCHPSGKVRWRALNHAFATYYPEGLLAMLGCDLNLGDRHNWLIRLCRRIRNHQHPLHHILMIMFLGEEPRQVLYMAMQFSDIIPSAAQCRTHQHAIRSASRLALLLPIKQKEWLTLQAKHQKGSMREKHGTLYSWLHRNCREWLAKNHARHTPYSTRLDWLDIDRRLAKQIPVIAQSILTAPGKPRRASRSAIAMAAGKPAWLILDHPHLPQAAKAIRQCAETVEDFACRRIHLTKIKFHKIWRCRVACGISTSVARRQAVAEALKNAVTL